MLKKKVDCSFKHSSLIFTMFPSLEDPISEKDSLFFIVINCANIEQYSIFLSKKHIQSQVIGQSISQCKFISLSIKLQSSYAVTPAGGALLFSSICVAYALTEMQGKQWRDARSSHSTLTVAVSKEWSQAAGCSGEPSYFYPIDFCIVGFFFLTTH